MDQQEAKDLSLISWLNILIVLTQWDSRLPQQLSGVFKQGDYLLALAEINRAMPANDTPPIFDQSDWKKLANKVKRVPRLKKLFENDPFQGATADEIEVLAEVSDITPNPQSTVYSRNGTFLTFIEALKDAPVINIEQEIKDGLDKFQILLSASAEVAEMLYKLAISDDWFVVLASLRDSRDYSRDDNDAVKLTLKEWNQKLTPNLRGILFKPTRLSQSPRKLIPLAWKNKSLFTPTQTVSMTPTQPSDDRKKLTDDVLAHVNTDPSLLSELERIRRDLKLLEVVAKHYVGIRKFAKLDGLVYGWPEIAALARTNYRNLEDVEEWLVKRKPRPPDVDLELREAKELFDLSGKDPSFIRFLRMRPYFSEIDEDEMRRYRPLAPVVVSDVAQTATRIPVANPSPPPRTDPVTSSPRTEVCELSIKKVLDNDYNLTWQIPNTEVIPQSLNLNVSELLSKVLASLSVSPESLAAVLKDFYSNPDAGEKLLYRMGYLLRQALAVSPTLESALTAFLDREGQKRLVISSDDSDVIYIPWEWLPRFGGSDRLLISDPKVSLARAFIGANAVAPPLTPPLRFLSVLANPPSGYRFDIDSSENALERIKGDLPVDYRALVREDASLEKLQRTLATFGPHVVHFEGFVRFDLRQDSPQLTVFLSSTDENDAGIGMDVFANLMHENNVQLVVIGRNEVGTLYQNPGPSVGINLVRAGVPAVLVPTHAIDNASATAFTMEFYREFLAGDSLEGALYAARRKRSAAGGDPTAFSLFANPPSLDFFQALPVSA